MLSPRMQIWAPEVLLCVKVHPPEVRVDEQVGLRERGAISCPTDHTVMEGRLYVANEPVQAPIALTSSVL